MTTQADDRTIILIGPIGAGKSTLAELLSSQLDVPRYGLDELRWGYYAEIGYDKELANTLHSAHGFSSLYQYWKPFEAHAVQRVLSTHRDCVIDFGGGHSVYEDDEKFEQVSRALEPYPFVVLVLPSPDPAESIRTLDLRNADQSRDLRDINQHFVQHHSNYSLAKLVVYTNGKTPEESRDEILGLIQGYPDVQGARPVAPERQPTALATDRGATHHQTVTPGHGAEPPHRSAARRRDGSAVNGRTPDGPVG